MKNETTKVLHKEEKKLEKKEKKEKKIFDVLSNGPEYRKTSWMSLNSMNKSCFWCYLTIFDCIILSQSSFFFFHKKKYKKSFSLTVASLDPCNPIGQTSIYME